MKTTSVSTHFPRRFVLALLMLCVLGISNIAAGRVHRPMEPRPLPDTVARANEISLRSNQFGYRLYLKAVAANPTGNQFFSPLSIFAALAMTTEGAAGSTLEAMNTTLDLPDKETLHLGIKRLAIAFSHKDAAKYLSLANAIWPDKSSPVRQDFLKTIQNIYLGGCFTQDFATNYEQARKTINTWVAKQTQQRIKDLLPSGAVDAGTQMVLTNAIYFKANWKTQFDKSLTQEANFYTIDGKTTLANMMHRPGKEESLLYLEEENYQVLQLPYASEQFAMTIFLPAEGKLAILEEQLDKGLCSTDCTRLEPSKVNVWIPRFKMELGGSIKPVLSQMGMAPVFSSADFSKMFEKPSSIMITDVFHKAFVEVNEQGTEAAASTAVVMGKSAPSEPAKFRADRPFIFMIQHLPTESVLFLGKVMDPGQGN